MLTFIDWQPSGDLCNIGSVTVRWYSFLWILGLFFAYYIVRRLYKQQGIEEKKFDPLFFYCFIGVLVGARLGHCMLYEPGYYLTSVNGVIEMFLPIQRTAAGWKFTGYAGLASHGGTVGLMLALVLYWKRYKLKAFTVLDNIAIATPITACCIRLGNLMNSEIIGSVTDVPWGFIFHTHESMVNGELVVRHPSQLYEAIAYFVIFIAGCVIYRHWHKSLKMSTTATTRVGSGFYFGLCLAAIFTFRFFVEFVKKEQGGTDDGSMLLDLGQILSIPFVIIGLWCMIRAKKLKA